MDCAQSTSDNAPPAMPAARTGWKLYIAMLVGFSLLYAFTAQRGPAWQDSGEFQRRVVEFQLQSPLGQALAHPLMIVLGKLLSFLPFGSLPWRINLVSALPAAVAVANVALLTRRLTGRAAAGCAAGLLLGLAHSTWWLATITESQALHLALFTGSMLAMVNLCRTPTAGGAVVLGLLNGLALEAHNLALLALPALGLLTIWLCAKRKLAWKGLGAFVIGWAIGAAGWLAMLIDQAARTGLTDAVRLALFGQHWSGAVAGGSWAVVKSGLMYILYNLPNFAGPLAIVGAASLARMVRPIAWVMAYLTVAYLLFAVRYAVPDQFMFFLPLYAMAAVLAGIGLDHLMSRRPAWRKLLAGAAIASALWTPAAYMLAPDAAKALTVSLPGRHNLPGRDDARYWLCPWKHNEDSAGEFARKTLSTLPPGAILYADGTALPPLWWAQHVEGLGTGVIVPQLDDWDEVRVGQDNIFVVSTVRGAHPLWMEPNWPAGRSVVDFRKDLPDDVVFRAVWKVPGTTHPAP